MWSRLRFNTNYTKNFDKEIREMIRDENNAIARIEFLLRYFSDNSWLTPFATREEALIICHAELTKLPQHNFLNYARAQLDNKEENKIKYLKFAANNTFPCPVKISAQAAYELSQIYFSTDKKVDSIPCVAWFSKSIILDNKFAIDNFLNNNLCGNDHNFSLTKLYIIFLTTLLSGKKLPDLAKSKILKDFENDAKVLTQGYRYPLNSEVLNQIDSPLRKIAEWLFSTKAASFVNYFSFCYQNAIISEDVFCNIILFCINSAYSDNENLKQRLCNLVTKLNLTHRFAINNPQPVGSYYYVYTAAPDMIPAVPQQPVLVPEYRAADYSAVATSPINTAATQDPAQEHKVNLTSYFSMR